MIISGENTVVTLKDSAGDGSYTTNGTVASVREGATLKVESGTYTSTGSNAFWAGGPDLTGTIIMGNEDGTGPTVNAQEYCVGFGKDSTLVVNGGTFTSQDNAVLAGNGTANKFDGATVTVNGGIFNGKIQTSGYAGCGMYVPNDATVEINGGTFNVDGVGICARAGVINIKGGEFISTTATEGWVGDKKTKISANGVFYDGAAKYPGLKEGAAVNITGGTFTNTADSSIPGLVVTQPDNGIEVKVSNTGWPEPTPVIDLDRPVDDEF